MQELDLAAGADHARRHGIPVSDADPFSVANTQDPYPLHAELRALGPVVWMSRYGFYAVPRYAEASHVLTTPEDFLSSSGGGLSDIRKPGAWRAGSPIAEVDAPQHPPVRQAMNRIFTPARVRSWADGFRAEASRLCDAAMEAGTVDAVRDLIEPYIFKVFTDVLGVELELRSTITIGDFGFNALGPQNETFHRSRLEFEALGDYFEEKQQREAMIPGGVGFEIYEAEASGELPPDTATGLLRTFIRGGMDTTISGLLTSLRLLCDHPDVWARVKADPGLTQEIFDESIRLESPVQAIFRSPARDVELGGVVIPEGVKVRVMLASANRDPAFWDRPEAFLPGQRPNKQLAFATGPHLCLGRQVARLEAECFMSEFAKRVDHLKMTAPSAWRENNALRTLQTLQLQLN